MKKFCLLDEDYSDLDTVYATSMEEAELVFIERGWVIGTVGEVINSDQNLTADLDRQVEEFHYSQYEG